MGDELEAGGFMLKPDGATLMHAGQVWYEVLEVMGGASTWAAKRKHGQGAVVVVLRKKQD